MTVKNVFKNTITDLFKPERGPEVTSHPPQTTARSINTEKSASVTAKSGWDLKVLTSETLFSEASSLVLASMRPSLALSYSFSRLAYFFWRVFRSSSNCHTQDTHSYTQKQVLFRCEI